MILLVALLLLVVAPSECTGHVYTDDAESVKNKILDLREAVARRHGRGSWVPKLESGIVLHQACHRYATGCSAEYVAWLTEVASESQHKSSGDDATTTKAVDGSADPADPFVEEENGVDTRRMCTLDEQLVVEASTEALLRDRLEQLKQERRRLLEAHSAAEQRLDAECSGRDEHDAVMDRVKYQSCWLMSEALQLATVSCLAWLPLATHVLLPSSLLVALLFWLFLDQQIVPEMLRLAQDDERDLWRRHRLVLAYSEHSGLHFVTKLQLLFALVMTLGVGWSLWDLKNVVNPAVLPWGLQYLWPQVALVCLLIFVVFVAVAPLGYMLHQTNLAWQALCEVYKSDCAMVQGAVL